MNGFIDIKCDIIRGGMAKYLTPMGPTPLHVNPIFEIGPLEPHYSEWLGLQAAKGHSCVQALG
ncbi:uncharacterized protein HaLaN_22975, partial [Haematococcus lacustris]